MKARWQQILRDAELRRAEDARAAQARMQEIQYEQQQRHEDLQRSLADALKEVTSSVKVAALASAAPAVSTGSGSSYGFSGLFRSDKAVPSVDTLREWVEAEHVRTDAVGAAALADRQQVGVTGRLEPVRPARY